MRELILRIPFAFLLFFVPLAGCTAETNSCEGDQSEACDCESGQGSRACADGKWGDCQCPQEDTTEQDTVDQDGDAVEDQGEDYVYECQSSEECDEGEGCFFHQGSRCKNVLVPHQDYKAPCGPEDLCPPETLCVYSEGLQGNHCMFTCEIYESYCVSTCKPITETLGYCDGVGCNPAGGTCPDGVECIGLGGTFFCESEDERFGLGEVCDYGHCEEGLTCVPTEDGPSYCFQACSDSLEGWPRCPEGEHCHFLEAPDIGICMPD